MPRLSPAAPSSDEGVQEKQPVAPLRIRDAENAHTHAETKIFGVAKSRLDRPAFCVVVGDLAGGRLGVAGRQTPGLLHVLGLDTNDRPDALPARRDFGVAELARPSARSDPFSGGACFAVRRRDV